LNLYKTPKLFFPDPLEPIQVLNQ